MNYQFSFLLSGSYYPKSGGAVTKNCCVSWGLIRKLFCLGESVFEILGIVLKIVDSTLAHKL